MNSLFLMRRTLRVFFYKTHTYNLKSNITKVCCCVYSIPSSFNYSTFVSYKTKNASSEPFSVKKSKDRIIKEMNFKCKEDAEPFYDMDFSNLFTIYKVTKIDKKVGYCTNRLYYLAEKIKCEPKVLSELIVKRIFIYTLSFDWLESSLKVLLDMGVSGERILRDLWVLKYHHKTIEERLQKVKKSGSEQVYPWMVRCSPVILERYIKITSETKDILNNGMSTLEYLAIRLETTTDVIENMCSKVPSLWSIRVIKVKSFLDYLFSEGFTKEDIINKPRVLATSQSTVCQRIATLRSLGVTSINLNILSRSKKDFIKYVDTLTSSKINQNIL